MKINNSETLVIKRSQINLNPLNPKRHSEDNITLQSKNIKKVGFLGGIVWNKLSSNIIDGHRRVFALDLINKYNGDPSTDYDIKVEVCQLDEKVEKEQMTYMAVGNTKADLDLIGKYAQDIDLSDVGLTAVEIDSLLTFSKETVEISDNVDEIENIFDFAPTPIVPSKLCAEMTPEQRKEHVKNIKEIQNQAAIQVAEIGCANITIQFKDFEEKNIFCDLLEISVDEMFINGALILNKLE